MKKYILKLEYIHNKYDSQRINQTPNRKKDHAKKAKKKSMVDDLPEERKP